jgi:NAD(P)-dependent dehydrogenase (short-subunit alcohol dehydrogenase family)
MNSKKVFLLFGSSGDLGKAAIDYFLNQEYDNYYLFTRKDIAIQKKGKNVEIVKIIDLSIEENIKTAFLKVDRDKNAEYFLFSTIGGFLGGQSIADTGYIDWLNMMNINLNVAFLIAKYFLKLIDGTLGGSICFTSAMSSLKEEANKSAYNISKNGLNYLVRTLSLEGKEAGLSANAVAPFIIDTSANREWVKDKTLLVNPLSICSSVQMLFNNRIIISGNIIELPYSL